jgi:uncharacterized NAD(P)/FAD-binding protein YdhS
MRRIAIVGAGFSGTVLAVQLLRQAGTQPLHIMLLERGPVMARGLAYGTTDAAHLLNVPAGNMSALADVPDHFLRHAQALDPGVQPHSFLPRRDYGHYLQALLKETVQAAAAHLRLERWTGEVTALNADISPSNAAATTAATTAAITSTTPSARPQPDSTALCLTLADGRQLTADHAVLALGHQAAADPAAWPAALQASPRCVRDPWAPGALAGLPPGPVLLLGSGLTALDVALTLTRDAGARTVRCLSRRGRVPAPHRVQRDDADPVATALQADRLRAALGHGVRTDLRALRRAVEQQSAAGGDWRDLIAALRAHTPAWWQGLPLAERRRFLRHLQPWWDTLRHRCAPPAHAAFQAAREAGQVQVLAGRLRAVHDTGNALRLQFTRRGQASCETLEVAGLVNCTGADTRLQRLRSPLIRHLLGQGLLQPDALALGAEVDGHGALIGADGRPHPRLHCIGPWLRARDWEAVAVPELRVHALHLAQRLLAAPR